jgi:hypothetical protein
MTAEGKAEATARRSRPQSARVRADLTLVVTALLWGSALVPGRIAAAHLGTMLYNGV